jgi:hypothetical protein
MAQKIREKLIYDGKENSNLTLHHECVAPDEDHGDQPQKLV